jgi:hypothetical protein
MKQIEIPYHKEKGRLYRFFEILPGSLSWFMLAFPFIISLINVDIAAAFLFAYILIYVTRAFAISIRALQGYKHLRYYQKLDWKRLVQDIQNGETDEGESRPPKWHVHNLARLREKPNEVKPDDLLHAVIIATYNEAREVMEPTIQSVLASNYDMKKVILIIAYEQRGGDRVAVQSRELIAQYKDKFYDAMAIGHPNDIEGEIIGKGGNVTYAGRELQKYLEKRDIDPIRVVVTTLDADNRPDVNYLAGLSYLYCVYPDPLHVSFQPIAMYTNNIWDAPAPMRVVATGNSFFHIAHSLRPHMLRNFSSHAQSMKALIMMDFWSVRTIVEDGHHFWRSYFRFDGNYRVLPVYLPIYQDAVLTDKYWKTLKAQFVQYRRWTWGASDVAYVATKGFFSKNKVPLHDLIPKFWRLLEGHVTWAVGPIISLLAGFIPALMHPQSFAANVLPQILSRIQTFALLGLLATLFICFKTLPPKPERYKRHRSLFMVLQWVYMPVTGLVYNSFAALYSQTRLMLGKYIDKFDVTEKAVVNNKAKK